MRSAARTSRPKPKNALHLGCSHGRAVAWGRLPRTLSLKIPKVMKDTDLLTGLKPQGTTLQDYPIENAIFGSGASGALLLHRDGRLEIGLDDYPDCKVEIDTDGMGVYATVTPVEEPYITLRSGGYRAMRIQKRIRHTLRSAIKEDKSSIIVTFSRG